MNIMYRKMTAAEIFVDPVPFGVRGTLRTMWVS